MNMADLCALWRMHLSVTYQSLRRLVCCTFDHCGGDVVCYHTPHDARTHTPHFAQPALHVCRINSVRRTQNIMYVLVEAAGPNQQQR